MGFSPFKIASAATRTIREEKWNIVTTYNWYENFYNNNNAVFEIIGLPALMSNSCREFTTNSLNELLTDNS